MVVNAFTDQTKSTREKLALLKILSTNHVTIKSFK